METFGEKISAEARSGKELPGLLKKMMMMMMMMMNNYDDTKIVKSCMSGFSRGKLEAGRYESKSCCLVCFEGLARLSRRVWRRFVRGSREISLAPSLLHRASTDALIYDGVFVVYLVTHSWLRFDRPTG